MKIQNLRAWNVDADRVRKERMHAAACAKSTFHGVTTLRRAILHKKGVPRPSKKGYSPERRKSERERRSARSIGSTRRRTTRASWMMSGTRRHRRQTPTKETEREPGGPTGSKDGSRRGKWRMESQPGGTTPSRRRRGSQHESLRRTDDRRRSKGTDTYRR